MEDGFLRALGMEEEEAEEEEEEEEDAEDEMFLTSDEEEEEQEEEEQEEEEEEPGSPLRRPRSAATRGMQRARRMAGEDRYARWACWYVFVLGHMSGKS